MASPTHRSGTRALAVFVVWTLYVWCTRIVNALGDDALGAGGKAFSVGLSLTFVAFSAAGAAIGLRARRRPLLRPEVAVLRAFAGWTTLVWLVRVPMIAVADHDVGFKVVHALLGVISIALAALVWRSTTPTERPSTDSLPTATPG
jgi:Na+/melibiose symporter-like transporter